MVPGNTLHVTELTPVIATMCPSPLFLLSIITIAHCLGILKDYGLMPSEDFLNSSPRLTPAQAAKYFKIFHSITLTSNMIGGAYLEPAIGSYKALQVLFAAYTLGFCLMLWAAEIQGTYTCLLGAALVAFGAGGTILIEFPSPCSSSYC